MTEICKICAECCKHHPFIDLSRSEITSLEQATGLSPEAFTNAKDQDAEEFFLQFQENGYCIFLTENNGNFSCSVYESRPEICKNYPSHPSQKELCRANIAKFQGPFPPDEAHSEQSST